MSKTINWTDDESQMFLGLKKAGKSYREIGKTLYAAFGNARSPDSLKHKWKRTNWQILSNNRQKKNKLIKDLSDKESEKEKIIERTLANNERFICKEEARTDIIIDNIKSCIYRLPKPKLSDITYSPSKTKTKKYTAEHVGIMVSDMHIGTSYSYDETGGLSQYNLKIFKKRLQKMKLALLEITERHRGMYDLPELHIFSLGDVIAGAPGSGQWNDNYIPLDIMQQVTEGTYALRDLVATWSTAFKKVTFYGIYGNHGRIGKKGQTKTSDNWDRLCYDMLKLSLTEYDNIEWQIPKTWWLNPQIQGHSFYLCHGDGVRGTTLAGVEKAESKIAGMLEQRLDYFLMGHFHSPAEIQTNSSRVIMNGCFLPWVKVWKNDGIRTPISNIEIGDEVIGKSQKPSRVTNIKKQSYKGSIVGIRVNGNSYDINCTPNHEFLCIKGNEIHGLPMKKSESGKCNSLKPQCIINDIVPKFTPAEYLGVGDYLAFIKNNNLDNDLDETRFRSKTNWVYKINEDICRLWGLYLAEGSISGHTEVTANGKDFCESIYKLCGKGSHLKKMHPELLSLPVYLQEQILIGYLQGDGHSCRVDRKKTGFNIMASTMSIEMRDQLAFIANNCGYSPYIREQDYNGLRKNSYWLIFRGADAVELSLKCGMPFNEEFTNSHSRGFINCQGVQFRKITQCWTVEYSGFVYDLEVKEQESYNVEGSICHNSFMGGDMYSLRDLGKNSVPEQKIFGIHKKKGITWTYNIYLDGE